MRYISTNPNKKMLRLRTMETILNLMMISFMAMKKLETFVTLTVALWIWVILATEMEFSYRSLISDQIGNFRLD